MGRPDPGAARLQRWAAPILAPPACSYEPAPLRPATAYRRGRLLVGGRPGSA